MKFISTRGSEKKVTSAQAISMGIADDGGLYVPESFPKIDNKELESMLGMSYPERTAFVLSKYLTDYDEKELLTAIEKAYKKFDGDPAPLVKVDSGVYILELFHGPTHAFKDMALTVLPYLLKKGCELSGIKENVLILTATSGDTGKAALEGFKDAENTKIMVFYPSDGVSKMQKLQMATQEGENVGVSAVVGNFDDCQTAVKNIFNDSEVRAKLKEKGYVFSSANSINFGRLAPQIAYYFSAYLDLVTSDQIKFGDKINFCVPTGNFGNILAAYYALRMGLPINKLICASNKNKILTDFITTGKYDVKRNFHKTMSPSMDILISSNLERLLFELSNRNGEEITKLMSALKDKKEYTVSKEMLDKIQEVFYAGTSNEDETLETVYEFFDEYNYPLDPHTAVGVKVTKDFNQQFESDTITVNVSTASPYKFPREVYYCITGNEISDCFKAAKKLNIDTAMPIPKSLLKLKNKKVRFKNVIKREEMLSAVMSFVEE